MNWHVRVLVRIEVCLKFDAELLCMLICSFINVSVKKKSSFAYFVEKVCSIIHMDMWIELLGVGEPFFLWCHMIFFLTAARHNLGDKT